MKRILIIGFSLIALGILYWLGSPLFITKKVSEPAPSILSDEQSRMGSFVGLAAHNATGTAKIVSVDGKKILRFEEDFKVTNGPDLFVYFGNDGKYEPNARIAALKGNEGGQNYEIPAGINPDDFTEVWVWCRAFSVPFGKAILN